MFGEAFCQTVRASACLAMTKSFVGNLEAQTMKIHLIAAALVGMAAFGFSGTATADDVATKDIVDTAVAAGQFKTLVAAIQAADLVETLKGDGPFTVFAPTDEAFAKIPKE